MLVTSTLAIIFSIASAAPAFKVKDTSTYLDCVGEGHLLDTKRYYPKAMEACDFFMTAADNPKPRQMTSNILIGYNDIQPKRERVFQPVTFALKGENVKEINQGKCEYAFTSEEALKYNLGMGNVCKLDKTVYMKGWDWEWQGRNYSAVVGETLNKTLTGAPAENEDYWSGSKTIE
jgi:hypothetical protein